MQVLLGSLRQFAQPELFVDSFLALFLLGLLFAQVRRREGHIATCIGLHAGVVTAATLIRKLTIPDYENPYAFLIGQLDGLVGYAVAVYLAIILGTVYIIGAYRPASQAAAAQWLPH